MHGIGQQCRTKSQVTDLTQDLVVGAPATGGVIEPLPA
jgi:hypothetical protein